MKKIKLTKSELKKQKGDLKRFHRYLPTLYIKKQQLQVEIERVNQELKTNQEQLKIVKHDLTPWMSLLGEEVGLKDLIKTPKLDIYQDNIAGVDIPVVKNIEIEIPDYDLFSTPLWIDRAIEVIHKMLTFQIMENILFEQQKRLAAELRATSQRVNLFEKVKIPEAEDAIRKISIYLGDLQTAAVGWARITKKKISKQEMVI